MVLIICLAKIKKDISAECLVQRCYFIISKDISLLKYKKTRTILNQLTLIIPNYEEFINFICLIRNS